LSEHRVGAALRSLAATDRVLSSKVGRVLRPDPSAARDQNGYVCVLPFTQRWDYSEAGVRRSVEDSLQRLGTAHLDVVFIHDCDAQTHGSRYPDVLRAVLTESIPELERMKTEGLIGHYGLGVNDVQVCLDVLRAAHVDCLLLAGRYSLLDQSALPELLPLCIARGVSIALGGVFNSGILATGVRRARQPIRFNYGTAASEWIERTGALEDVCDAFAVPLRAAALQFPLACPAIEIVIAGAQTPQQWQDAVAMMSHPIPHAFWARLRELNLLPDGAWVP
jgi:D-threo-aldose 1-dehydrogenase